MVELIDNIHEICDKLMVLAIGTCDWQSVNTLSKRSKWKWPGKVHV